MDTVLILAELRNRLHADASVEELTKKIVNLQDAICELSNSPFQKLMNFSLDYSKQKIHASDKASAIIEIQFIHNLPLNQERLRSWDKHYFLSIELQSYIDSCKDCAHFEDIVILLGEALTKLKQA